MAYRVMTLSLVFSCPYDEILTENMPLDDLSCLLAITAKFYNNIASIVFLLGSKFQEYSCLKLICFDQMYFRCTTIIEHT